MDTFLDDRGDIDADGDSARAATGKVLVFVLVLVSIGDNRAAKLVKQDTTTNVTGIAAVT